MKRLIYLIIIACLVLTNLVASENAKMVLDAVYARHRMVRIEPTNPEDRSMAAQCEMANATVTLHEFFAETKNKKLRVCYALTLLNRDWQNAHKPDAFEDSSGSNQVKAEQVSAEMRVLVDYLRSFEKRKRPKTEPLPRRRVRGH